MPNKNYLRGYKVERNVVNTARDNGWLAIRSAGSHSVGDVFLFGLSTNFIIQLKRSKKIPSQGYKEYLKDIETLKKIRVPPNTIKQLWCYIDRIGWHCVYTSNKMITSSWQDKAF